MNLALHGVRSNFEWKTPFNRPYTRAAVYWLGALIVVMLARGIRKIEIIAVLGLVLATPVTVFLLAELSRQLRRYANFISLMVAPDLEFSSRGLLALHSIRSLLIVAELATALGFAALLASFVGRGGQ